MNERIQKILSARGVASRRQAEAMIQAGRVICNGQVCQLGQTADPDEDVILIDGSEESFAQALRQTEAVARYRDLTKKQAMRLQL